MAAVCYTWNAGPAGASSYTLSTQTTAGFQNCDPFYGDPDNGGIYSGPGFATTDIVLSDGSKLKIDSSAVFEDVVVFTPSSTTTQTQWTFKLFGSDGSSRDLVINRERGIPAISSISPFAWPSATGGSVTITGNNFVNNATVTFGGTAGTGVTVVSPTQVNVTAPPHAVGTVDVVLTTSGGSSTATSAFVYLPTPFVTSVSPTQGPTGGGNSVTINGTDLGGATGVTIGGNAATITSNTASQITVTAPGGSAGTVDVLVTTNGGQSAISASAKYTYVSAPTVSSISPASGPTAGGTSVAITGTGFSGVTAVKFGATNAGSVFVNSATLITVASPAGSGTVDITVTTPGGTSTTSAADQFTYTVPAPAVSGVSPGSGPAAGGTSVTITGANFTAASTVAFGSTAATSVTFVNSTTLNATAPAGTGTADVRVTTVNGTSPIVSGDVFTYIAAPTITSISPTSGPGGGGTNVTINGTGFTGATAVTFGGTAATTFNVTTSTSMTAQAPAGTGTVDIRVTTPGGTTATSAADQFTYIGAPTVTSISPNFGPTAGGTTVTISGTNLSNVSGVKFGASNAISFSAGTGTQLTAISPAGAAGVADVTVTTSGGTSTTGAGDRFTYVAVPTAAPVSVSVPFNSVAVPVNVDLSSGASAVTQVSVGTGPSHGQATVSSNTSLTYRPTAGYSGADSFTYTLTNVGGTSTAGTVTVIVGTPTIAYSPPSTLQASVGASYSSTALAVASGGSTPYSYSIATGHLPQGLTLDSNGTLHGMPTSADVQDITVRATDNTTPGGPYSATSGTIRITTVAPTITFSTTSLTAVPSGTAYNQLVTASGGTGPYNYSIVGGSLPPGVTLNAATGAITGNLKNVGSFTFTLQAKDANQFPAQIVLTLQVTAPVLAITTVALTDSAVGTAYTQTLTASGGVTPYTFTATGLPSGLSVTGNAISGTPTQTGTFTVVVRMTDSTAGVGAPYFVDKSLSLTVNTSPMTLAPATLSDPMVGQVYEQTMTASGGVAPYHYVVTAGSLPNGLRLDPTTGVLGGTPTAVTTSNFTITARDSSTGPGTPLTASTAFSLSIKDAVPVVHAVSATVAANSNANPITLNLGGGAAVSVAIATAPAHGMATASGTGINYTPTAGYSGPDSFTYTATNASGTSAPATVTMTVNPLVPIANAVSTTVAANSNANPITLNLGGGAAASLAIGSPPTHGVAVASGTSITYTPATGYSGSDSFTYTATNASGTSAPATVTVTVNPLIPVANAVSATVSANSGANAIGLNLGGGAAASVAIGSPPTHGVAVASGTSITYTPTTGYSGSDSFTYTATNAGGTSAPAAVTVTVNPLVPVANAVSATVSANSGANAIGLNLGGGAAASVAIGSPPTHGVAVASGTSVTYTPATGYSGSDSFTYTATNAGGTSAPAAVTVTVNPLIPVANAVSATVSANSGANAIGLNLGGGAAASVAIGSPPTHGVAVASGTSITYTPTTGYSGSDSFTYTATNAGGTSAPAAVTVTVNPLVPVANAVSATVSANSGANAIGLNLGGGAAASVAIGSPPTHGVAMASGTSVTYTPTTGYSGSDSFTYTATNAGGTSAPATVTITVNKPVPAAPAVTVSTLANQSITIDAAANASDGPFTALVVSTPPVRGTVVVQGMTLVYTPVATVAGPVSFAYTLSNSTGVSLPIPVTVQVNSVPVVLAPIQVTGQAAQALSVDVTAGATGGPFTDAAVLSVMPANAGTAILSSTNAAASMQRTAFKAADAGKDYIITFTPAAAFAGTAVVSYTLSNSFMTSPVATLSVTIASRVDPSMDADVRGLVNAQIQSARRFATAQLSNYNQRLEQLRNPQRQEFSNQLNVVMPRVAGTNVRDCQSMQNPLEQQACYTAASHSGGASQFNQSVRNERSARAGLSDGSAAFTDSRDAADEGGSRLGGLGMAGNSGRAGGARAGVLPNMGEEEGSVARSNRPQWAFWTAGSVDFGFADMSSQQSGLRFTTSGVTVGADYLVTDKLAIGAGLGYGHDRTKIGELGTRSSADSVSAAVYGSYSLGRGVYVDGVAGYNSMRFDSRRWVEAANDFAQGQRDGDQWFAALSAGYEYRDQQWLVSPYGRVLMSSSKLKRFDETGAGINALTYFDQRVTTTSGVLGLRTEFSQDTPWGVVQPFARVEVQHDFEGQSDARLSYADIVGLGSIYQISGTPYGRDRVQLGLGSKLKTKAGDWSLDFQLMRSSGLLDRRVRFSFTTRY